jgi:hypothetical protein
LDVLQGISRGILELNGTLRRIAAALEGRSGSPELGAVWPERPGGEAGTTRARRR